MIVFAGVISLFGAQIQVSTYGAVPNDGQDDAAAIQAAVNAAGNGDSVVFSSGAYDLVASTNGGHIYIYSKTNLTLLGAVSNGVPTTTLLRHVSLTNLSTLPQVIYNRNNTNITIKNFIMDNTPRQTTAGTVVAKDPGGTWIRVQIFNGLPMNAGVGCYAANAWLPTVPPVFKDVPGLTYGDTSPTNWIIYDATNRIVELNTAPAVLDFIGLIKVGEIMTWHYGVVGNNMMYNGYNNGFVFQNIRVPNVINAFASVSYCRNVTLKDITLGSDNSCPAVGPRDGFHCSMNSGTMVFENVDIEGVRQDPIVLRSRYARIGQVTDSTHFRIEVATGGASMPAGSTLGLWSAAGQLEYVTVSSATYTSSPTNGYNIVSSSALPVWAGVGTELKMSAFMPDSVLISRCDFKNNAGSDVICFSDNVTVISNTHFKASDAAIYLGSNDSDAGVCGNNIKIQDSIFTDCGWVGKNEVFGAISIENENAFQTAKVNDLEIRGNIFDSIAPGAAIALRDIDGCDIASNTFIDVWAAVSTDKTTSTNVSIHDNAVYLIDKELIDPYDFTASASESYSNRGPAFAVNGSGMNGDAHTSVTPTSNMWMGTSSSLPKWFKIDLAQTYSLDHMKIYNFNWAGYTTRGCRNVQIFYSNAATDPGNPVSNASNWTAVGSAFDLTQAPGDSTYGTTHPTQPDTVNLSVTGRWVAIKINSHYGGSYGGLSEVRFWKKPNVPPGYTLLDSAGYTASASDSYSGRSPVYAVNGAGMLVDAHTSGTPTSNMWMAANSTMPKWFKVDIGQSTNVGLIQIYNFNMAGYTSRGCKNVQVFYSNAASDPGNPVSNSNNWTAAGSAFDLTQAPGDDTYGSTHPVRPDTVNISATARWIAIKVNSQYGGGYGGLSEVRIWQ